MTEKQQQEVEEWMTELGHIVSSNGWCPEGDKEWLHCTQCDVRIYVCGTQAVIQRPITMWVDYPYDYVCRPFPRTRGERTHANR